MLSAASRIVVTAASHRIGVEPSMACLVVEASCLGSDWQKEKSDVDENHFDFHTCYKVG